MPGAPRSLFILRSKSRGHGCAAASPKFGIKPKRESFVCLECRVWSLWTHFVRASGSVGAGLTFCGMGAGGPVLGLRGPSAGSVDATSLAAQLGPESQLSRQRLSQKSCSYTFSASLSPITLDWPCSCSMFTAPPTPVLKQALSFTELSVWPCKLEGKCGRPCL